jgi:ATP-binding cassette subfamily C protein
MNKNVKRVVTPYISLIFIMAVIYLLVGFGGKANKLSYGEKQRYALANILSQEKEILILDEVTSSSDVILENEINNILLSLKRQKTIIAIAHRFNILKYCDEIIYMHDGKIIDIGSFETLSKKYDEFKKMVELSSFKCN